MFKMDEAKERFFNELGNALELAEPLSKSIVRTLQGDYIYNNNIFEFVGNGQILSGYNNALMYCANARLQGSNVPGNIFVIEDECDGYMFNNSWDFADVINNPQFYILNGRVDDAYICEAKMWSIPKEQIANEMKNTTRYFRCSVNMDNVKAWERRYFNYNPDKKIEDFIEELKSPKSLKGYIDHCQCVDKLYPKKEEKKERRRYFQFIFAKVKNYWICKPFEENDLFVNIIEERWVPESKSQPDRITVLVSERYTREEADNVAMQFNMKFYTDKGIKDIDEEGGFHHMTNLVLSFMIQSIKPDGKEYLWKDYLDKKKDVGFQNIANNERIRQLMNYENKTSIPSKEETEKDNALAEVLIERGFTRSEIEQIIGDMHKSKKDKVLTDLNDYVLPELR